MLDCCSGRKFFIYKVVVRGSAAATWMSCCCPHGLLLLLLLGCQDCIRCGSTWQLLTEQKCPDHQRNHKQMDPQQISRSGTKCTAVSEIFKCIVPEHEHTCVCPFFFSTCIKKNLPRAQRVYQKILSLLRYMLSSRSLVSLLAYLGTFFFTRKKRRGRRKSRFCFFSGLAGSLFSQAR